MVLNGFQLPWWENMSVFVPRGSGRDSFHDHVLRSETRKKKTRGGLFPTVGYELELILPQTSQVSPAGSFTCCFFTANRDQTVTNGEVEAWSFVDGWTTGAGAAGKGGGGFGEGGAPRGPVGHGCTETLSHGFKQKDPDICWSLTRSFQLEHYLYYS